MPKNQANVVWLVRHGHRMDADPEWRKHNPPPAEPPLSPLGQAQADQLARRLAKAGLKHIFSSPFPRAVQTACMVARRAGLSVKIEPGAGEWLRTRWFPQPPALEAVSKLARTYSEIDAAYAPLAQSLWPEDKRQVFRRLGKTIRLLVREFDGPILVVGHGITVLAMTRALLKMPVDVDSPLCGLNRLEHRNGKWLLRLNGDTDHLKGRLRASLY